MINLSYCVCLLLVARKRNQRKAQQRRWYLKNRRYAISKAKEWAGKNSKKCYQAGVKWRAKNFEKRQTYARDYYREYFKAKRRADPDFRLLECLRARVRKALMRNSKSARTEELLGCSVSELKQHLARLFKPGMTWENCGLRGWHVDHIKPCAKFDFSDPAQQRECFHYTNLQPLWALENIKKGDAWLPE